MNHCHISCLSLFMHYLLVHVLGDGLLLVDGFACLNDKVYVRALFPDESHVEIEQLILKWGPCYRLDVQYMLSWFACLAL